MSAWNASLDITNQFGALPRNWWMSQVSVVFRDYDDSEPSEGRIR